MRASNPTLNASVFNNVKVFDNSPVMTLEGTVNKTMMLLLIVFLGAFFAWNQFAATQSMSSVSGLIALGGIGGFITAMITIFKKDWSPITAPIYAGLEGLLLGGISAYFETLYPGIVFQAVLLTFGTMFGLLMAYQSGKIRATENFKLGVFAATAGIGILYLVSFVMGFFGTTIPYIHESGMIGIGFSGFVVVIAALNLVLDFDFIENAANSKVPKYMEWYASFGLLVTLVWLYLEILKLLAKLRSRK
ncbi:MAG: Bax inhibitor-1/YccA family protein [Candidatus Gastranaerophilales bacterium]|nr:Bax inhibitor-1/YccA family protein [Candidatus Gastranaerophilales bacterium]